MTRTELARVVRVRAWCRNGRARDLRQQAGLSLREVAGPIGVRPTTVMRWENGKASPSYLSALAYGELLEALEAESVVPA